MMCMFATLQSDSQCHPLFWSKYVFTQQQKFGSSSCQLKCVCVKRGSQLDLCHFCTFPRGLGDKLTRTGHIDQWLRVEPVSKQEGEDRAGTSLLSFVSHGASLQSHCSSLKQTILALFFPMDTIVFPTCLNPKVQLTVCVVTQCLTCTYFKSSTQTPLSAGLICFIFLICICNQGSHAHLSFCFQSTGSTAPCFGNCYCRTTAKWLDVVPA